MADQKISELTAITGANTADDDELVIVDTSASQTKKITLGELENALAERDFSFGDNDKLTFGAGSDLQIYHDGSNSYIDDAGTGLLRLRSNQIYLEKYTGEIMAALTADAGVNLRYDNGIKLETTSTGVDITGNATFDDNGKAIFGAGSDLQIYHSGTHSFIEDTGTGNLYIDGSSSVVIRGDTSSTISAVFNDNGAVNIRYGGDIKLATTSTGIDVTGNATFGDNDKAIFGASSDLQIYHDGSGSFVDDQGTGGLILRGTNLFLRSSANENYLGAVADGSVTIYHDNAPKLETTSTGIDVTGTVTADGLTVDGQADFQASGTTVLSITGGATNAILSAENSRRLKLQTASTTRFNIDDNGDISFYEDTGTTAKFFWDASAESLGIGTTSPAAFLDVTSAVGSTRFTGHQIFLTRNGNNEIYTQGAASVLALGTNSTERMRIDSSGNVGIGTDSPNLHGWTTAVTLNTSSNGGYEIGQSGTKYGAFALQGDGRVQLTNFTANPLTFQTNNTERMRIDSSGNVGIGTSSPDNVLHADNAGSPSGKFSGNGGSGEFALEIGQLGTNGSGGLNSTSFNGTSASMKFQIDGSEAMRIDSSGNLLVGTTDTSPWDNNNNDYGVVILKDGYMGMSSNNTSNLDLNRQNGDGNHINLYLEGTKRAQIGVVDTDIMFLGSSDGLGIKFNSDNSRIDMCNASGVSLDASADIGGSSSRIKDLYLSGGVYLGGTGSANKLDDYEEGTWTPTAISTSTDPTVTYNGSTTGRYTKVGNHVNFWFYLKLDSVSGGSGNLNIGGLPFTNSNDGAVSEGHTTSFNYYLNTNLASGRVPFGYTRNNDNKIYITISGGGDDTITYPVTSMSNGFVLYGSGTMKVA